MPRYPIILGKVPLGVLGMADRGGYRYPRVARPPMTRDLDATTRRQALISAALGPLAPGALMDSALPDDAFAGRAEWLLGIAHDGYEAGREVGGGVGCVGLT